MTKEQGFPVDRTYSTTLTIHGKGYTVTREQILQAAQKLSGAPRRHSRYFVVIGGQKYGLASLLWTALDILPVSVSGQVSYRCLDQLGFKVYQEKKDIVETTDA